MKSGADLSKLTDFVHVPEPGKGVLVFVIEQGVQLGALNVSSSNCSTYCVSLIFKVVA
jgi:alkylhydroperoxidase family enzyme